MMTRVCAMGWGVWLLMVGAMGCDATEARPRRIERPEVVGSRREEASATEIVERVRQVYATSSSYRDAGLVERRQREPYPDGEITWRTYFSTLFVRPHHLRLDLVDRTTIRRSGWVQDCKDSRTIVRWDHATVRMWNSEEGEEFPSSLALALGVLVGVSSEVSTRIPDLLMPAMVEREHAVEERVRRLDDQRGDDGREYFRVQWGRVAVVWVDRESYLIRRADQESRSAHSNILITTRYDPVIGGAVVAAELESVNPVAETFSCQCVRDGRVSDGRCEPPPASGGVAPRSP
jgi:hypothetical protein